MWGGGNCRLHRSAGGSAQTVYGAAASSAAKSIRMSGIVAVQEASNASRYGFGPESFISRARIHAIQASSSTPRARLAQSAQVL